MYEDTTEADWSIDITTDTCDPYLVGVESTSLPDEYEVTLVNDRETVWNVRFKPVYPGSGPAEYVPGEAVLTANGNLYTEGEYEMVSDFDRERMDVLETAFRQFAGAVLTDIYGGGRFGLAVREYGIYGGGLERFTGDCTGV